MKLICTLKNYILDPEINLFAPEGTIVEVVQYNTPTTTTKGGILVVAQSVLLDNQVVLDYP